MDKQQLRDSLADTLRANLPPGCCAECPAHPKNGMLGLDIAYIWIKPWLYGDSAITPQGAWRLAVEYALHFDRHPVLAEPRHNQWVFRVPMHMADPKAQPSDPLAYETTLVLGPRAFADAVESFQQYREEAEDKLAILGAVLGLNELSGEGV